MEKDLQYSKHKECGPEETVSKIRGILDICGIETQVLNERNQFESAFSNRIVLKNLGVGTNGKGTTKAYALASGYAEFMERLENDSLGSGNYYSVYKSECGFYHFPDENLISAEEYAVQCSPVVQKWLGRQLVYTEDERKVFFREYASSVYDRDDGVFPVITFYDECTGKTVELPVVLLRRFTGSNGMAAGNTLPEAVVQGLSEIFERYVQTIILKEQKTPPVVPRKYLRYEGVADLIRKIESSGRYTVTVYDCSLGRGFPVVGTMITDKERGTFGLRFGAHPSFGVAVERTLTEAFQGKTLEHFTSWNAIGTDEDAASRINLDRQYIQGTGLFPAGIFINNADWSFQPWRQEILDSNETLLLRMLDLLKKEGFSLLIRNNSHLGFPACHVLVPGMSEILSYSNNSARNNISNFYDMLRYMNHFPDLTEDEENKTAALITECLENQRLRNPIHLFRRPLSLGAMAPEKILGFWALKNKRYEDAHRMFNIFSKKVSSDIGRIYWKAMTEYTRYLAGGLTREQGLSLIRMLYTDTVASRVERDTEPKGIMERRFRRLNCYDCKNCALTKEGECSGLPEIKALLRAKSHMDKNSIVQQSILQ